MLKITWLLSTAVGAIRIDNDKNASKSLVISITMRMWGYYVGHIAQWSTSRASLEATVCHHRASACTVLPRRRPWSTILTANTKTLTKQLLASNL
jgi:hypothetical protein